MPLLQRLSSAQRDVLTGQRVFPALIAAPLRAGLALVFGIAIGLYALIALASLLRAAPPASPRATQCPA